MRRLDAEHQRLDELAVDDLAVRASFDVSYQGLQSVPDGAEASDAGVFRLLGCWKPLMSPSLLPPSWWDSRRGRQKGHWSGWWMLICWNHRALAATTCTMWFITCTMSVADDMMAR